MLKFSIHILLNILKRYFIRWIVHDIICQLYFLLETSVLFYLRLWIFCPHYKTVTFLLSFLCWLSWLLDPHLFVFSFHFLPTCWKKKKKHFSSVFKKGGWRSKCNVTFNYMKMTLFYLHILLIVWLKNSELNISPYWIEYCCFTVISLSESNVMLFPSLLYTAYFLHLFGRFQHTFFAQVHWNFAIIFLLGFFSSLSCGAVNGYFQYENAYILLISTKFSYVFMDSFFISIFFLLTSFDFY